MAESNYIHGYTDTEQQRLFQQSQYWEKTLIPLGLDYQSGDQVLEIGCAVGATLEVLHTQFPGIQIAGLDHSPDPIHRARQHFASAGISADLQIGEAESLPWPDRTFDHIYIMWLLEHLLDPLPVLQEARRVLQEGGSITLTETDYTTHVVYPLSADYDYLAQAQYQLFQQNGNPLIGRQLGSLLYQSGFANIQNHPVGFHFFHGMPNHDFRHHVDYLLGFLQPMVPVMVQRLNLDEQRLHNGLDHLQAIPDNPDGAMTTIVYRAQARSTIASN